MVSSRVSMVFVSGSGLLSFGVGVVAEMLRFSMVSEEVIVEYLEESQLFVRCCSMLTVKLCVYV